MFKNFLLVSVAFSIRKRDPHTLLNRKAFIVKRKVSLN